MVIDVRSFEEIHRHNEECVYLARARVRALRSEIAMNQAIIEARNAHVAELHEIVAYVRRHLTRANIRDIIRMIPEMRPYFPLTDNDINNQAETNNENIPPLVLPSPPRLARQ